MNVISIFDIILIHLNLKTTMELFILWIGLALLVGVIGKDRNIGFGWSFFWSLILSPLIGVVIALLSDKKNEAEKTLKTKDEDAKKKEEADKIAQAETKKKDADAELAAKAQKEKAIMVSEPGEGEDGAPPTGDDGESTPDTPEEDNPEDEKA